MSRFRPDVVIVDDCGDDGWRLTGEAVARLMPKARRVVASRLADERLWLDVLDSGAFDLVRKPFEARELASVLRTAARCEEPVMAAEIPALAAVAIA
ncbi:MAG: hypothetical protein U0Q16_12750 [Bryobacteraceae bacterium]